MTNIVGVFVLISQFTVVDIFNLIRRKWLGTGVWNPDFDSAIQLRC